MKFGEIVSVVEGTLLFDVDLSMEIPCAGAADLMSDVLAFAEPGSVERSLCINPCA